MNCPYIYIVGSFLGLLCLGSCEILQFTDPTVLYPLADIVVIKQDRKFVSNIETLDLFGGTHFAYLLFDIVTSRDLIQMYLDNNKNPVAIKIRFVINWGPNVGSQLSLRRASFPDLYQWDEQSINFELTEKVELGPELGVTFVPRDEWFVEFDIRDEIFSWLRKCDVFRPECRYMTFQLSTTDPHWVKVYSKEALKDKYKPQLIFSEGEYALNVPLVADTGVVRQIPERGFGHWPTLDLIKHTHVGFVEFNLIDVLGHIQSIHDTTHIKLRMWVEWAQAAWGNVIAEVVYLGQNLNETQFKWADSESPNVIVAASIGTERVCSKCMVEWDLTPLLTTKYSSDETRENRLKLTFRDLARFQIRLRTEQMSWVKLASKEYYDATKRPIIIFSQVTWIDLIKPYLTVFWTLYHLLIPPLKVPIFGACLAAFIHKTRKYTWPIMNFIVTRAFLSKQKPINKITINTTGLTGLGPDSPSLPTPRRVEAITNDISGIDSGLENGLSLRTSSSTRSLPKLETRYH